AAKIKVPAGHMPAYYAKHANVQHPPIVVVCQEIYGIHEWISDLTRRLAHAGAFAIAPDYYFRLGDMPEVSNTSELMPKVNRKTDAELFADLDATSAWAKSQGGDGSRLGIIGFCRGGRNV